MTTSALWIGILPWLRKIGRWLIERLVQKGTQWLLAVMEDRIDAFKRRRARTKLAWRKRWLLKRIFRWTKAHQWVSKLYTKYAAGTLVVECDACMRRARAERIPLVSPDDVEPKRAPKAA